MNKGLVVIMSSFFIAAGFGGYLVSESRKVPEVNKPEESDVLDTPLPHITGKEIGYLLQERKIKDKNVIDSLIGIQGRIKSTPNKASISREQGIMLVTSVLIDEMEGGFHPKAYDDGSGVLTIGIGSIYIRDRKSDTERRVRAGDRIGKQEAVNMRNKRIKENYLFLTKSLPHMVLDKLNVYSIAALNSYIYNIGQSAFLRSEVYKLLKAKMKVDINLISTLNRSYITASGKTMSGLVKRRKIEAGLLSLSSKKKDLARYLALEGL